MADELFSNNEITNSEDKIKQDSAILNNPRIMTVLVAPDGTTAKALPQDVDALISEGYRPLNGESEWEVSPSASSEFAMKVKGSELKDLIKKGWSTNKFGEYQRQEEELADTMAQEKAAIGLSPLEAGLGLASSVVRGVTLGGGTDLLTRAANELIGLAKGDDSYGAEASKQLLELRDELGVVGGAVEMAGSLAASILTGGLSTGLTGLAKVGALAAEGAAGNALGLAGRQALGDESINANSYAWATGLGAGLGGGLAGIGNLVSKGLAKKAPKLLDEVDVNFGDLSRFKNEASIVETVPILNNGKLIGTANLSRLNPDSYHPGTRGTGVTLENLTISPDAPKGTAFSVMKELTDTFGSVTSPSKLDALDSVRKDFSLMGSRKMTENGDEWFSITQDTLPRNVSEDAAAISLVKRAMKILGKMPSEEEKRSLEIVEKIFNKDTGGHRKAFITFMGDQDKALADLHKDFRIVEDMVGKQKGAAEAVRDEIGKSVTKDGMIALKDEIYQVQKGMLQSIQELDNIGTNSSKVVRSELQKLVNDLDNLVIKNDTPSDVWKNLLLKKREMYDKLDDYMTTSKATMDSPSLDAYSSAYNSVNNAIKSDKVIGEKAARILVDLDRKAAISADTADKFMSEFGKVVGNKRVIDPTKINQAYAALRAGTRNSKLSILDTFASDTADFARAVKSAQKDGLIQGMELPVIEKIMPLLDKVNKYREFIEASKVLSTMSGGNLLSGILQSTGATLGSLGGYAMGGAIGGVIGSQVGGALPNLVGNPINAIKFAQKASGAVGNIATLGDKLAKIGDLVAKTAVPIQRTAIVRSLGAKKETDNKKYVDSVRTRLTELARPESIGSIDGTLGDHFAEAELKKTAKAAYDYALSKLPATPKFSSISKTEAMKVDKLLYALTNPAGAMKKAMEEGDTEIALHLQEMFPVVYEMLQKGVMGKVDPDEKLSYQKRLQLQKLTGIPYTKTSQGANKLARSVFANKEEAKGKNPNLTIPSMPAGAEIQD